MADDEIDRDDIPALTDACFRRAVGDSLLGSIKTPTTIDLDADALAWFEAQGGGYEARINAVLRCAMLAASDGDRG